MTGAALVVVVVALLLPGCGGDAREQEPDKPPGTTVYGIESGGRFDVGGGRDMYIECTGSGSPTVVLEAGFGGSSYGWAPVLTRVGETTRTCAYDRAGLGGSDAIPGVHDASEEIEDLERLLDRAEIEPPYVLVGHSYGGILIRLFARAHPGETAGLVLVDAMGLDSTRRQLALWPESAAPRLRREWATPVVDGVDLRAGETLDRSIRSLGDIPLVVITAARHREGFEEFRIPLRLKRAGERLWDVLQAEIAALSSDHAHVVALRSDHVVHRPDEQPLVVVRAVRAIVRAHRDGAPLPSCEELFSGPGVRCRS